MYYFLQKKSYEFWKFIGDIKRIGERTQEIISHKRNYIINSPSWIKACDQLREILIYHKGYVW